MKRLVQVISWIALAATLGPALAYLTSHIGLDAVKFWMLAGTVVWFATVPWWMDRA